MGYKLNQVCVQAGAYERCEAYEHCEAARWTHKLLVQAILANHPNTNL